MKSIHAIFLFLALIFVGQLAFYFPSLPMIVATHFDFSGAADGFMSKKNFIIFELFLLLFVFGLPFLQINFINKLPFSMIKLPNKDYWLSESRRETTLTRVKNYLEVFSIALLFFFIAINQLIIKANLTGQLLPAAAFWFILTAFLSFTIIWVIKFHRQFQNTNNIL